MCLVTLSFSHATLSTPTIPMPTSPAQAGRGFTPICPVSSLLFAMRLTQPPNDKILASLSRRSPDAPSLQKHDAVANAYLRCSCHPDVVERLWDGLGAGLTEDCRFLIYDTPTLAHPASGLILAVGIGTRYGLRVPTACIAAAQAAGAPTLNTWSGGGRMDICQDYGEDWVFGSWLAAELTWCRAVYDAQQQRS